MKLETQTSIIEGNHSDEDVLVADIAPEATDLIMENLISNYQSPFLASLREYVSNAWDSHVESGQTKPVQVTLPLNGLSDGMLIIEDFGVGMSMDEITSVFKTFYKSSKRDDENATGGFGIGSKSGLALGNQVLVSSVKDGLKNIFVMSRESGRILYRFIVKNKNTDEPSGVKIQVSTDTKLATGYYTPQAVNRVLGGWSKDEVYVTNGDEFNIRLVDNYVETEHGFYPRTRNISNKFSFDGTYNNTGLVLVGRVLYPSLDDNSSSKVGMDYRRNVLVARTIVPKFGASDLRMNESREQLKDTQNAREKIMEMRNLCYDEAVASFRESLKDISLREAIGIRLSGMWGDDFEMNIDGIEIPRNINNLIPGVDCVDIMRGDSRSLSSLVVSVGAPVSQCARMSDADRWVFLVNDEGTRKDFVELTHIAVRAHFENLEGFDETLRSYVSNILSSKEPGIVCVSEEKDTPLILGPRVKVSDYKKQIAAWRKELNKIRREKNGSGTNANGNAFSGNVELPDGTTIRDSVLKIYSVVGDDSFRRYSTDMVVSSFLERYVQDSDAQIFVVPHYRGVSYRGMSSFFEIYARVFNKSIVVASFKNRNISDKTVEKFAKGTGARCLEPEEVHEGNFVKNEIRKILSPEAHLFAIDLLERLTHRKLWNVMADAPGTFPKVCERAIKELREKNLGYLEADYSGPSRSALMNALDCDIATWHSDYKYNEDSMLRFIPNFSYADVLNSKDKGAIRLAGELNQHYKNMFADFKNFAKEENLVK